MSRVSKFDYAHMTCAETIANLSHCTKRKVGAVLVNQHQRVLLTGYNGTSAGRCNTCEDENNKTFKTVHHAEANLIGHAAKHGISTDGTIMYVTTAPCIDCAKLIEIAGIVEVNYKEAYKSTEGVDYLINAGIAVNYMPLQESI